MTALNILKRPRRNRMHAAIRTMTQETRLHPSDLIAPFFVIEGENRREEISSMPGAPRLSVDLLLKEIEELVNLSVPAVALFPVIPKERKDPSGSEALNINGLLTKAIQRIKNEFPSICLITDVALDPYTSHGHDGLVNEKGEIINDETVEVLSKMAVILAQAGIDIIAPSDMMDGRVKAIRLALDANRLINVGIMSYSAKYASCFYSPFRDALQSAPKFGDKKTYQMNPANAREAIIECQLDEEEGADFLMVKPALPYLDVISKIREMSNLPIVAYQVSGEYSMLMAAGEKGWLNPDLAFYECALAIKRAGADAIFTYAAKRLAKIFKE